jgi:hypothetical protein
MSLMQADPTLDLVTIFGYISVLFKPPGALTVKERRYLRRSDYFCQVKLTNN